MKPTASVSLLRPWQKYKDHHIFYGLTKTGNKRWSLSTKDGNKNFYKGTGSAGIGRWTNRGQYRINWEKVRTYVVPSKVDSTDLKPLVDPTAPDIRNHFQGYNGATDGKLQLRKVMEFVKYGLEESPEMERKDGWKERG